MRYIPFIYFLLTVNSFCFSQIKNELTVEFNVNQASFKMDSLNIYFQDTFNFYNKNEYYFEKLGEKKIDRGINYNLNINYQMFEAIGFGLFYSRNQSSKELPMQLIFEPYPGFPDSNIVIDGINQIAVTANSFGGSTELNLNKIFKLNESKFKIIRKIDIKTRIMGGVSFTKLQDRMYLNADIRQINYQSRSFHGKAELCFGYQFNKSLIKSVGLKVGYQYLATKELRNFSNSRLEYGTIQSPRYVSLDFGGFYYGVYLTFGK